MQIQIRLTQEDIETAIRDYLAKAGMSSPVDTINFTVSRKGGQSIEADIDLSPEAASTAQVAVPSKPVKRTTAKAEEKAEVPEAVEPEVTEDTPPFVPDNKEPAANETVAEQEDDAPRGKSLFG